MTQHNDHGTAPAKPQPLRIPLSSDGAQAAWVILHQGRVVSPPEGLRFLRGFHADGTGAWVSAARATSGQWGYIDQDGHWRVPPTLDDARDPSDNETIARYCVDGLWGYIDLQGRRITEPLYADCTPSRGGLASVQVAEDQWRIIDATGTFTCDAVLLRIDAFDTCGLARALHRDAKTRSRLFGFVDRTGTWVIPPTFELTGHFEHHEVTGATQDGELWGLIDTRGQWVLPPCHAHIDDFNADRLAHFRKPSTGWGSSSGGYLDLRGKAIFEVSSDLADTMVCGMARNHYNGRSYLRSDGSPLPAPRLQFGTDFQAGSHFALVLAEEHAGRSNVWGLLHADGRFVPAPETLLEPVVNSQGSIVMSHHDTPLVPFVTQDDGMAWMDGKGQWAWHARYDGSRVVLENADGHIVWEGSRKGADCRAPRRYFRVPHEAFLENIATVDEIVPFADALARDAEHLLHRFAAGENTFAEAGKGEASEDDEDDEEDSEDEDPMHYAGCSTMLVRKLLRTYLDENEYGNFVFLSEWRNQAAHDMFETLRAALCERLGPDTPDPEQAVYPHGMALHSWPVRLAQPLSGDSGVLEETRTLWVSLYHHFDTGDGDVWNEIHLAVAPSIDALQTAMRMREQGPHADAQADSTPEHAEAHEPPTAPTLPQTRDEWLVAVQQERYVLQHVPEAWLDDAMADAAVSARTENLEELPARLQTPQRLEALIRSGLRQATDIPPHCMTQDGLALARSLYAGQHDWEYRDEQGCRLPTHWDKNALYGVWGAVLTPELALKAVKSGVALRNVPTWLRTEALEQAALAADIYNISYVDKARITPALAARAVRHDYGCLIAELPPALLTPELCLASVRTNGSTLENIPEALRTEEVCVAALQEHWTAFRHVPQALRVAVTSRMIEWDLDQKKHHHNPQPSVDWQCQRAWAYLGAGEYENALAEAQQAAPRTSSPEHMHYVQACALRALGRLPEATVQAATVLSLASPYAPDWDYAEDTRWLAALARGSVDADDAGLVARLAEYPRLLAEVPRERITDAMVEAAIAADLETLRFVPHRLLTPQRYALAVRAGVKSFSQIPPTMLSEAAYVEYVRESGWRLSEVPQEWRTVAVCAQAVCSRDSAMEHVPEELREAVAHQARALQQAEEAEREADQDDDEAPGDRKPSWLLNQLARSVMRSQDTAAERLRHKGLSMAWIFGAMLGAKSDTPPTLRGPLGWLEQRPVLAVLLNALLALIALVAHIGVTVGAWRAEGTWIGLGTFVLMGFADLYWAWRFLWSEPASLLLGLSAIAVALYLFVWRSAFRRVATVYAQQQPQDD